MAQQYYKRTYAKKCEYKGITFDSKMEMDFAMFLDGKLIRYKGENLYHKPIRWIREGKRFELIPQDNWRDRTERDKSVKTILRNKRHTLEHIIYTPDFYLPDYDLNIEIKGYQYDDALYHMRLRIFRHFYPDEALAVIRHHHEFLNIDEIIKNTLIEQQ